jgi:hypothetical protein
MLLFIVAAVASLYPAPIELKIEGLLEPVLALSEPRPRFAFTHILPGKPPRGLSQAGYHILVTSIGSQSAVVWDSGRVNSSECSEIVYSGSDLTAFAQYSWSILWLGSDGVWSAAASATFEMGPISSADWGGAKYLTSSQLRYEFDTPARVTRARAYIAAAGCNVVEVNGRRPARDFLGVCDWTVFSKRILYQTHNITDLFTASAGKNAIGLLSGQVMNAEAHTPTLLRGIIRLEFEGSNPSVVLYTGSHWWQAQSFVTNQHKRWATEMNWAREVGKVKSELRNEFQHESTYPTFLLCSIARRWAGRHLHSSHLPSLVLVGHLQPQRTMGQHYQWPSRCLRQPSLGRSSL